MPKLLSAKIDVTKIPRHAIYVGEKGKYISIDIWVNEDPDNYGNDCSINMSQTKEEREAKSKKIYIGNGKKKFGWGAPTGEPMDAHNTSKSNGYLPQADDDEIPF